MNLPKLEQLKNILTEQLNKKQEYVTNINNLLLLDVFEEFKNEFSNYYTKKLNSFIISKSNDNKQKIINLFQNLNSWIIKKNTEPKNLNNVINFVHIGNEIKKNIDIINELNIDEIIDIIDKKINNITKKNIQVTTNKTNNDLILYTIFLNQLNDKKINNLDKIKEEYNKIVNVDIQKYNIKQNEQNEQNEQNDISIIKRVGQKIGEYLNYGNNFKNK